MTTLESITHSYPASLLPSLPLHPDPPFHFHSPSRQKLSYKERQSLSQKAQGINIYDLGWRRNLKEAFFGNDSHRHRGSDLGDGGWDEDNDKRVTIGMALGAMWPTKIGYDKYVSFLLFGPFSPPHISEISINQTLPGPIP